MSNPLAAFKAYANTPAGKRVLVLGGGAVAGGAGLYARHKKKTAPASSSSTPNPIANPGAIDGNAPVYVIMTPASGYPMTPPATTPPATPPDRTPKQRTPAATAAPTYSQLEAALASGHSTYDQRVAFWQLEDPNYGGGSTPQSRQADANLARITAARK